MGFEQRTERFSGTVTNTMSQTVLDVRVEIHLSNGACSGAPGESILGAGESVGSAATATAHLGDAECRGYATGARPRRFGGM